MSDALRDTAVQIAADLAKLDDERRRVGRTGLAALKQLDPETAGLAKELWDDEDDAVDWFTVPIESLGWRTPWQCIGEGERNEVQRVLKAIAYGLPA